ncbi:gas vesicle protein GvpO [Bacillus gobiensis]|uniref:gas vesicle protein GvpO n=1 Tax=Bacillus gobiensis TaxID=1441095 RepID=UPI003D1DC4CA
MEIQKIMKAVNDFFNEHVAPPHKIISVETAEDEGWKVMIEVIEEKDYMKRYAKDEMLGVYQVFLNKEIEVASFSRKSIRYRSSIGEEA